MVIWEWLPELTVTHDVARRICVPPAANQWGAEIDQDLRPPQYTYRFTATGMIYQDVQDVITAVATRGHTFSLYDKFHVQHYGTVLSLTAQLINGSFLNAEHLYSCTIQLRQRNNVDF